MSSHAGGYQQARCQWGCSGPTGPEATRYNRIMCGSLDPRVRLPTSQKIALLRPYLPTGTWGRQAFIDPSVLTPT